jgi:hypothetical protein
MPGAAASEVSDGAIRVALAITLYINRKTFDAFPGLESLMQDTGMSRSTVIRAVQQLEAGGHLKVRRTRLSGGKNGVNHYAPVLVVSGVTHDTRGCHLSTVSGVTRETLTSELTSELTLYVSDETGALDSEEKEGKEKRSGEEEGKAPQSATSSTSPPPQSKRRVREASGQVLHLDSKFVEFRAAYPRRLGSCDWSRAAKIFALAVKKGANPDDIIRGARAYDKSESKSFGTEFIKMPGTWLHQQCWMDFAAPDDSKPKASDEEIDARIAAYHRKMEAMI